MGSVGANNVRGGYRGQNVGIDVTTFTSDQLRNIIVNNNTQFNAAERRAATSELTARGENPPLKPSQVTVNDDYYTNRVGRPRGTGNWAFFPDSRREDLDNVIFVYGNYTEAKRQARIEAARRGWSRIYTGT